MSVGALFRKRSIVKRLEKYVGAKDSGGGAKPRKHLLQILALSEPWVLPPDVVRFGKHDCDVIVVESVARYEKPSYRCACCLWVEVITHECEYTNRGVY